MRTIAIILLLCSLASSQTNPAFEVATIKPSPDGPGNKGIGPRARRLEGLRVSVVDMLTFSHGIHRRQIVGAPAWAESDEYDFVAQPGGEGPISGEQWRAMLQRLMADRFQLAFHHEKRKLPVFALQTAGRKVSLKPSGADPNGLPNFGVGSGTVFATNVGMADFAHILQEALLDRPVVDQTKLAGKFDFTLKWTPEDFQHGQQAPAQARPDAPPLLFEAMREQLGVKLKATTGTVDVIVIDRVERPSAN